MLQIIGSSIKPINIAKLHPRVSLNIITSRWSVSRLMNNVCHFHSLLKQKHIPSRAVARHSTYPKWLLFTNPFAQLVLFWLEIMSSLWLNTRVVKQINVELTKNADNMCFWMFPSRCFTAQMKIIKYAPKYNIPSCK